MICMQFELPYFFFNIFAVVQFGVQTPAHRVGYVLVRQLTIETAIFSDPS